MSRLPIDEMNSNKFLNELEKELSFYDNRYIIPEGKNAKREKAKLSPIPRP